jgi:hypothetical protein
MRKTLIATAVASGLLSLPTLSVASNGFIEDSKANLLLRNFYINQDNRSGAAAPSRAEEWGQGVMLDYRSGYTQGPIGLGLDFFGQFAYRLDSGGRTDKAGRTRNPGTVFPLDDDNSAVSNFGRVDFTAKARVSDTELRVGMLQPRLPVLTQNDGRLLPQTFRGAYLNSREVDKLTLHLGQIERANGRASTDYEKLLIAGGSERVNQFRFGGADYLFTPDLNLTYYHARLQDYYQQHFVGVLHTASLGAGKLVSDLRYFDNDAYGANERQRPGYGAAGFNNQGKVDNRTASGLFTYSQSGHSLGLGYQRLSGSSAFPFVNAGDGATAYLITDSQIGKFLRAGERTWLARYGYDFAQAGIPGLRASGVYLRGTDVDTNVRGADNEWERNLRVDYKLQSGLLKDLDFSVRHASLRSNVVNQRDIDELRFIVSYSLPLL